MSREMRRRRNGDPGPGGSAWHLFGYPGGAVLPIYDALFRAGLNGHVLVRTSRAPCTPPKSCARSTAKVGLG